MLILGCVLLWDYCREACSLGGCLRRNSKVEVENERPSGGYKRK